VIRSQTDRTRRAGHADRSVRLAPRWAPMATTVAVLVVGSIGALVWHSSRLGSVDAWALRALRAQSYPAFQLASAVSASLRVGAVGATLAVAAFAWVTLRRLDAVVLALGSPAVVLAAEKLLKQAVARRSPGSGVLLYPSGHLAVATALALTAVLVVRLSGMRSGSKVIAVASACLFVLLLGRARLAETAHSLSDVVGGMATGVAVTLAVALLLDTRRLSFIKDRHRAATTGDPSGSGHG
jgi:membrane-associated phospholipid phosphatase